MKNRLNNSNQVLKKQLNGTNIKQKCQYKINPSFQGVNRLLVLLFENDKDGTVYTKYFKM